MNITRALQIAGVPAERHAQATASVNKATAACKGLLLHKLKGRWLMAGKIAEALPWEAERLCFLRPEWADYDIALAINITCNGDCGPWTPDGVRPLSNFWLNPDPNSEEYQTAVKANYWLPGTHPRSKESRKAWYLRNSGEYKAWRLGQEIWPSQGLEIWRGEKGKTRAVVWHCSGAWLVKTSTKLVGKLHLNSRAGYEIDNVFSGDYTPQMWWPLPGYPLRAPVTNSTLPGRQMTMQPKRWETVIDGYTSWKPA